MEFHGWLPPNCNLANRWSTQFGTGPDVPFWPFASIPGKADVFCFPMAQSQPVKTALKAQVEGNSCPIKQKESTKVVEGSFGASFGVSLAVSYVIWPSLRLFQPVPRS